MERRSDLILGFVLLGFAMVWTIAVYLTVPTGYGVGPRAFPLYLGILLAGLSAILVINSLRTPQALEPEPDSDAEAEGDSATNALRFRTMLTVCLTLAAFGYLMQKIGFIPATVLVVSTTLIFVLGERRPLVVIGMALGLSIGSWIAFGQILGAYMPRGTWFSLF